MLAQVTIPLCPVPITGQTLAVLLVGATLGAVRGGAVDWCSTRSSASSASRSTLRRTTARTSRASRPSRPTGFGYIIGFILAAALVGWLSEREWDRKFLKALATFAGGTLVVFAFGLPWLAVVTRRRPSRRPSNAGLYPFIIGGIIKAVIAADPAARRLVGRRQAERSRLIRNDEGPVATRASSFRSGFRRGAQRQRSLPRRWHRVCGSAPERSDGTRGHAPRSDRCPRAA